MGILVAFSVLQLAHQLRDSVADHERDRFGKLLYGIRLRVLIGHVQRVGLRRERHVDHRLRQVHGALRHSDQMTRLIRRHSDLERLRVGEPDVLARKARHPARDIQRILPRFQHARKPVHRRIRIGIPHGLVQRRDQIVVLLALLVIQQRLPGSALLQCLLCDRDSPVLIDLTVQDNHLERRQRAARITVRKIRDRHDHFIRDPDLLHPKTPVV